jgi:hypothetical protein
MDVNSCLNSAARVAIVAVRRGEWETEQSCVSRVTTVCTQTHVTSCGYIYRYINRAGWRSGSALNLHSGGACFEFWPGYRLPWLRLSFAFLTPSRQMPGWNLDHLILSHSLIFLPFDAIKSVLTAPLNKPQNRDCTAVLACHSSNGGYCAYWQQDRTERYQYYGPLGYNAMYSGRQLPMLQRNLLSPSSV